VTKSIQQDENVADSKWLLENIDFFPPKRVDLTVRPPAPAEETEDEIAAAVEALNIDDSD
jgi:hypothetical protein